MKELRSLRSLVDGLAEYGQRPAVLALRTKGTDDWSYAKLADHVKRLARGLAEAGAGKGDPVALLASSRPEWLVACLAVIDAGAVAVPLDVQLSDEVLRHVLKDSGCRLLFTTNNQLERLDRVKLKARVRHILLDAETKDDESWQRLLTSKLRDAQSDSRASELDMLPPIEPDDPAVLFYTSGTIGPPKGVPLSHKNLVFQLNTLRDVDFVDKGDRFLLPLPLHHVYPFVLGMLAPLTLGLPIVLPLGLTGPQVLRALEEGEVTAIIGVPRLYRAFYEGIEKRVAARGFTVRTLLKATVGLSTCLRRRLGLRLGKFLLRPLHKQFGPRLRILVSGGAALDPDLAWKLEGLGWQTASGYGLTETAPMLTLDPPGRARIGSVGRPLPGVDIRIDPAALSKQGDGAPRKQGPTAIEGEILARGPGVFSGYHQLPEKTAEAFTPDGWFRTGDLGYLDEAGYLYVTGRVKTLIVAEGGEKAQPDQVEEAYQEHAALREVGVLQKEGRLVAVIMPRVGHATPSPEARGKDEEDHGDLDGTIRAAVEQQSKKLPTYQRISDYVLCRETLPRTQLGKIQRHRLEELYEQLKKGKESPRDQAVGPMAPEEMNPEDRALLENPAAQQVWDWLVERFPERRLTPDTSPQLDLGIDSMEWLNLTLEIRQRAGVELSDEAIAGIETIRDVLRAVGDQGEAAGGAPRASPLDQPEKVLNEEQKRWLRPLGALGTFCARILFDLDRVLMRCLFRVRAEGLENLPHDGPYVLTPNHASYLDSLALAAALGHDRLRHTYWAGWTGVAFSNPLARLMSRLARVVPIDPTRSAVSSLAFGAAVLKQAQNLIWYPEGGLSPTGKVQPFKPGIGVLLHKFHVPVVPVFLQGSRAALPPWTLLPHLELITVRFGQPLDPARLEREGDGKEPHDRIANALHDHVVELGDHSIHPSLRDTNARAD
jgi:long-chain acyl-CoA synthetase